MPLGRNFQDNFARDWNCRLVQILDKISFDTSEPVLFHHDGPAKIVVLIVFCTANK